MPTILEQVAAHGFTLENTGGNCTALVKHDGAKDCGLGVEEIITVQNDARAPKDAADVVVVGLYDTAGEQLDETHGYTLGECLAALENPALAEYSLLSLKLYNGARASSVPVPAWAR